MKHTPLFWREETHKLKLNVFGVEYSLAELQGNRARITKLEREYNIFFDALQQIAASPEEGHPANLLKMIAQQALDKVGV